MRKRSLNRLKTQTILWIVSCMALSFIATASILLIQYHHILKKNFTDTIYLSADKKVLELNTLFNSAEILAREYEDYILTNLDEDRLLRDPDYEASFMQALSKKMSSMAVSQKGVICTFFRMEMESFGPDRGVFLVGGYQKSYVSVRTTDLSKYSPTDDEHVGWYYKPIWKKAPVWTSPYVNQSLRLNMISYCIPVYRGDKLLGITGVDLSLPIIQDITGSLQVDNTIGLLLGTEQNLITLNRESDLLKAVDRSANLSMLFEQLQENDNQNLQKFLWDGHNHLGILRPLDNGMSYILAISQNDYMQVIYGHQMSVFSAFFIVCIITIFLIIFILRKIIIPLKVVRMTTNRLARGELYIDIPYQSNNEIGTLADNIRMMTTQLKEYIEYISAQTQKEREAKEAALTESQINAAASQAKSAFLANMSHEIRTPINAVLGMNEMILRESKDKTILGYATNIKIAGANLLSIVNDVLDFSKIEAGKMELLNENYEVSSMIIDLINMTRERALKKGLNYVLNISPNLPKTLFGDSVRLKQCILNLLTNAIKYTKEGSITFSINFKQVDFQSIQLTVHVKDTGCGIKKEDMLKLFAPFERIEEEKNRTIEGSGLGMSIVRRLLDMMGTKLDVKSIYGRGSDFSFVVKQKVSDWTPVGDINVAYAESVVVAATYKEALYAPKARLLFVDDTAMNLDVIKGLLKNTGMKVDTVLSGKEALEAVKKNQYDILFIDHRMPELDGIETLHAMKEMSDNLCAGKPCIALTANAISGVRQMYLSEGFDDYLSKPVNPAKLEKMIISYLPKDYLEEPLEITPENNEDYSDFLKKMHNIEELDADSALTNCGSEELLSSTIKQYHSSIDSKAFELQQYFEAEDWENYGIKVHALKSTSRLIGALTVSKLAEHLEECANKNDIDEIKKEHKNLLDLYLQLKNKLEPLAAEETDDTEKTEISEDELSVKIKQIIECADSFDIDGLDKLITELKSVKLPLDFSEKFDNIRECVEKVDFQKLKEILSEGNNK